MSTQEWSFASAADPTGHPAAEAPAPLLADRYQLSGVIGRGGMAQVYRATDLKLGRPVAVKVLLDDAGDESDRARFIAEAQTLAMLSHTNLVTVLDAGFDAGGPPDTVDRRRTQPFLVMELVEGSTLSALMAEGPVPLDRIGAIAVQLAEALGYVHSRGVVHRDVKPGNILLGPDHLVKLADFGIARLIEQRSGHTRTGMAIGTAAYIAPEQVNCTALSGAADIYSLGLVLLEAITGRREYVGSPTEAALARLTRGPAVPALPTVWSSLLAAMTALEPRDRPTPDDVAAALRPTLLEPTPESAATHPDPVTSPILASTGGPSDVRATQPLTTPPAAEPPAPQQAAPRLPPSTPAATPRPRPSDAPRTSAIDRAGDALAHQARDMVARLRRLPAETWGAVLAILAVLLFLVVMAVVGGGDDAPSIPTNTPEELREPLTDLHRAVRGNDG